jgi:hypothetical protein
MSTKRKFVMAALGVIASLLMAAVAMTQPTQAGADNRNEKLLGSWNVEVTTVAQGSTFPALLTFTADGSVIADEPPSPFETSGHGNWVKRGDHQVAYTFVSLIGSAEGPLSAKLKVVGTLTFDGQEHGWQGPFKIDVLDPDGTITFTDHGTFTLTRIEVESLD